MHPVSTPCSGQTGGPYGLCCGLADQVARRAARPARAAPASAAGAARDTCPTANRCCTPRSPAGTLVHLPVEPDIAAVAIGEERRREKPWYSALAMIVRCAARAALDARHASSSLAQRTCAPPCAVRVEIPARRLGRERRPCAPATSTARDAGLDHDRRAAGLVEEQRDLQPLARARRVAPARPARRRRRRTATRSGWRESCIAKWMRRPLAQRMHAAAAGQQRRPASSASEASSISVPLSHTSRIMCAKSIRMCPGAAREAIAVQPVRSVTVSSASTPDSSFTR